MKRIGPCLILCMCLASCGGPSSAPALPEASPPPVSAETPEALKPVQEPADMPPSPVREETASPEDAPPSPEAASLTQAIPSPGNASDKPVPPAPTSSESPVPETVSAEDDVSLRIVGPDGALVDGLVLSCDGLSTVYDALKAACERENISLSIKGSGAFAYVEAIGGYAEFDGGPLSGWIYKINGVQSTRGVGAQTVAPGDAVSFYYSTDMGADVSGET